MHGFIAPVKTTSDVTRSHPFLTGMNELHTPVRAMNCVKCIWETFHPSSYWQYSEHVIKGKLLKLVCPCEGKGGSRPPNLEIGFSKISHETEEKCNLDGSQHLVKNCW